MRKSKPSRTVLTEEKYTNDQTGVAAEAGARCCRHCRMEGEQRTGRLYTASFVLSTSLY